MKMSVLNSLAKFVNKNSSKILTGAAIAGVFSTVYFAIKATPKACQLIEGKKQELEVEKLPVGETLKTVSKIYAPMAISGLATVGCMFGATMIGSRQAAALVAAANISDVAYKEYREAIKEKAPELHKEVVENISEKHLVSAPCVQEKVLRTGHGDDLCYDSFSGRYFTSDTDFVKNAVNEFNARLIHEMALSVNDFYDHQDMEHNRMGDILGWNINGGIVEVEYSSKLTSTGKPVFVINFYDAPYSNFDNCW